MLVLDGSQIVGPNFADTSSIKPELVDNDQNIFWKVNDKKDSYRLEYKLQKLNVAAGEQLSIVYAPALHGYKTNKLHG